MHHQLVHSMYEQAAPDLMFLQKSLWILLRSSKIKLSKDTKHLSKCGISSSTLLLLRLSLGFDLSVVSAATSSFRLSKEEIL